ncbi:MAG: rRNA maturation RNase YbeY [Chloroflexi bacterium]|nr:rRNA maturation RNase YbeY [Chloroflexota bacterium]
MAAKIVSPVRVELVAPDDFSAARARIIRKAVRLALERFGPEHPTSVSVAIVDAPEIQRLNRTYRGVDSVTDVLSFAAREGMILPQPRRLREFLGDIVLCNARALAQAKEYGHSAERELAYLTVHGVLHLLGYDHHEPLEQQEMRTIEERVMQELRLLRSMAGMRNV